MEALLQIMLSFSIYLGLLFCFFFLLLLLRSVARRFACFLFGVYSIVDFSISMDAETVIDAPLLDIYVFVFVYHFSVQSIVCAHLELHFILSWGFHFKSVFRWIEEREKEERAHCQSKRTKYNFIYTITTTKGIWCAIGVHTVHTNNRFVWNGK